MVTGHIEQLSGIIRIGEDCEEYGSPYSWCAVLRNLSPFEVEVMAALRAPSPDERRAIREVLRANGIREAFYKRRTEKGERIVHLVR